MLLSRNLIHYRLILVALELWSELRDVCSADIQIQSVVRHDSDRSLNTRYEYVRLALLNVSILLTFMVVILPSYRLTYWKYLLHMYVSLDVYVYGMYRFSMMIQYNLTNVTTGAICVVGLAVGTS